MSTRDLRLPDLSDRIAVVTGGNGGIGAEVARALAGAGATVAIACRDITKGETAATGIRGEHPQARVEVLPLDLADLSAVAAAAEAFAHRHDRLHILVNNAGVMWPPFRQTVDGFELQFATNHLGHYALTGRLLPCLLAAEAPRVVTVASVMHRVGRIDFANLDGSRGYAKRRAYAQSKLANLLFAFELQRRAAAAGAPLQSLAAHPGWTSTNLLAAGSQMSGAGAFRSLAQGVNAILGQSPRAGALPVLVAATSEDAAGGQYYGPSGLFELRGRPKRVRTTRTARDADLARRLWEVSEELTGVTYDALAPASGP